MTLVIVVLLLLGYLLLATSHLTNVNKAATAMFVCAVGWVLYVCFGSDFIHSQHNADYLAFLAGAEPDSDTAKAYIYNNVFTRYVARTASVVLFLLATMSIIELLDNNGCFDFIGQWIRTRNSHRLLWTLTFSTFIISANLDNVTTTITMLVIMRGIVQNRRQRLLIGSSIVLAANAGGCFTVIGDPTGIVLWDGGAVTASNFSKHLCLPALVAWIVPTYLMGRALPERLDVQWPTLPYRGDDTNLNNWQRVLMLVVGMGGLWFIPTFHNITKLSPFLGALCVLSILWVINEVVNRRLLSADQMTRRRVPRALQYDNIQTILYVIGIMLGVGAACETGCFGYVARFLETTVHNVWAVGALCGLLSGLVDTFAVAMSAVSTWPVAGADAAGYAADFAQNGAFWKVMAYATGVGGCLLCFSNASGLALMKMERLSIGWYFRNCTPKIALGWALGFAVLYAELAI